ncbi:MAG: hypothetical protein K9N55_12385 [Phycisphaerae bacterium]|nr:hypothetical protein [Phycisphaerae bacterium]
MHHACGPPLQVVPDPALEIRAWRFPDPMVITEDKAALAAEIQALQAHRSEPYREY